MKKTLLLVLLGVVMLLMPQAAGALGSAPEYEKEFLRIMRLDLNELTEATKTELDEKYPGENWEQYDFPAFVHTNDMVETGYKVAVKNPEMLRATYCYCFCSTTEGHESLLSCFWKDGIPGGTFDDHASTCNICVGQAMASFLLYNRGYTEEQIDQAWEDKYGHRREIVERQMKEEAEAAKKQ